MADMNGFSGVARAGSGNEQEEIDRKYLELTEVLSQNNPLSALDWLADYSVLASRSGDIEGINLYVDEVISRFEQNGYGNDIELDSEYSDALHIISNTISRLRDGKIPTGYERILADKYIKSMEQNADCPSP